MDTGTLLPASARKIVYVLTAMFAAAYPVAEANASLHWGWLAAWAAWNAGAGLLAASNTPSPFEEQQRVQDRNTINQMGRPIADPD